MGQRLGVKSRFKRHFADTLNSDPLKFSNRFKSLWLQTVEKMAEKPEFGELRKIRSSYKNNIGSNLPPNTYALNKRQSIAVASRLN